MAILRDLSAVLRRVGRVNFADDRERSDAVEDIVDGGMECRIAGGQRLALKEDRFARPWPELGLDQPGRAAGLAGNRVVLLELARARGLADQDGDDDETEPAGDRELP